MQSSTSQDAYDITELNVTPKSVDDWVNKHLDHWETLSFTFDMDKDSVQDGSRRGRERNVRARSRTSSSREGSSSSNPPQDYGHPPGRVQGLDPYTIQQLQLLAASGQIPTNLLPPNQDQMGYYRRPPEPHNPAAYPAQVGFHPHQQLPPHPYFTMPQAVTAQQSQGFPPPFGLSQSVLSPNPVMQPPSMHTQTPGTYQSAAYGYPQTGVFQSPLPSLNAVAGPSNTQGAVATEQETMHYELDDSAMAEDKRRRNTAASARFRVKKKHKTLNLERSVAELEGRAEDLEKEATELRRENGWLKEMLIMKGRRARDAVRNASSRDQEAHEGANESDEESESEPSEKEDPPTKKKKEKSKEKEKSKKKGEDKDKEEKDSNSRTQE